MTLPPPNQEQKQVIDYLNYSNEHIFITGKAGTGKTHVLRWFRETTHKNVLVCAPTGIAALNAVGSTIHNLLGLRTTLPADDHQDMKTIMAVRKMLDGVQAIVIDEVSMVSSAMLDAIDRTLRRVRMSRDPFGGMQIIMFGDIYQLPPVVPKEDQKFYRDQDYKSEWFFDAHVWEETEFRTFGLQHIQRQADDTFKDILNGVRDGTITPKQLQELNAVGARKPPTKDAKLLLLGSRRDMVAEHNTRHLSRLKGRPVTFQARVNTGFGVQEPADRKLLLKVGAHVMMLNNDRDERWVNGTQGVITALNSEQVVVDIDGCSHMVDTHSWVKAGFPPEEYKTAPKFWQLPMRLAWGVTIHKSQGLSLPSIQVDIGTGAFSAGQTYVALSRVTSPEGLYLRTPINRSDIKVDPNVRRFFASL